MNIPRLVSSKIRLYADDILLYSIINSNEDCISLQNDIDKLLNWSRDWQLLFNYEKCEYLRITNKISPTISTYYMGVNIIKEVSSVKYLGVTINSKLNWSEHILQGLPAKLAQFWAFSKETLKNVQVSCYKSLVLPVLEYGCTIWDPY